MQAKLIGKHFHASEAVSRVTLNILSSSEFMDFLIF